MFVSACILLLVEGTSLPGFAKVLVTKQATPALFAILRSVAERNYVPIPEEGGTTRRGACSGVSLAWLISLFPRQRKTNTKERQLRVLAIFQFKQLPGCVNSSFLSQTRKLRDAETTPPSRFHAPCDRALVPLFPDMQHTTPRPPRRKNAGKAGSEISLFSSLSRIFLVCC